MKNWVLIILGIGCLLVVGSMAASSFFSHQGEVSIVNQATELVVKGEINICDQNFTFENIKPRESKIFIYKVTSDSHYKIEVEFGSGKKLTKEIGYVTNGLDFKDTVVIKNDDIELMQ